MSNPAVMERHVQAPADAEWVELDDAASDFDPAYAEEPSTQFIELEPPVVYGSQHDMRLGPRTYTAPQAEAIERAVEERRALSEPALPVDD